MTDYSFIPQKKSIHIVIFTGGAFPEPERTVSYWHTRKPDYVIAADSGLETALKYSSFFSGKVDFMPEKILGDFDSLADMHLLALFPPHAVERFSASKDWTDTELALERAYGAADERGCIPFVTLVGGDGGRIDHLLAVYDTFAAQHHAAVWLLSCQTLYFLAAGTTAQIGDLTGTDTLSVARTTSSRTGGYIESHGLKWESNVFRTEGMPSMSNWISDEYLTTGKPVTLAVNGADFLLIVPYTAEVRFLQKAD
jgi:thiamine pyrophosphokinase